MTTTSKFQKVNDLFQCKLKLENGEEFTIPLREDGYIYATALCKAVGKQPKLWLRIKETKDFIKELENNVKKSEVHICTSQNITTNLVKKELIEIYRGNSGKYNQGTWIHPDLGIQLAQWCSPSFSLQISKWIRELIFTDSVEIGNEKSEEEIDSGLKSKLKNAEDVIVSLEEENKEVSKKYHKLYQTHQYYLKKKNLYKLKEGPCIYLFRMEENSTKNVIKIGVSGQITNRSGTYRTSNPYCKLLFLIYSNDSSLIEKNIKHKYEKHLYSLNSECVSGVNLEILIKSVFDICELLNIEYTLETEEEIEKFNRNIIPIDEVENELKEEIVEINSTTTKRCGGIHHTTEQSRMLPLSEFFKNKGNSDGVNRLCKECYLRGRYGDKRKRRKVVIIPKYDILLEKWCNRCESVKTRNLFYNSSTSKDGISANCKDCKSDQKKKYNEQKKEKEKEKEKETKDIKEEHIKT